MVSALRQLGMRRPPTPGDGDATLEQEGAARVYMMTPLHCDTSRTRTRCRALKSSCAGVFRVESKPHPGQLKGAARTMAPACGLAS